MRRVILDLYPQPRFALADELAVAGTRVIRTQMTPGLWIAQADHRRVCFDMIALTVDDRTTLAPVGAFGFHRPNHVALLAHMHPRKILGAPSADARENLAPVFAIPGLIDAARLLLSDIGQLVLRVPFDLFNHGLTFSHMFAAGACLFHTIEFNPRAAHATLVGHAGYRNKTPDLWGLLQEDVRKSRLSTYRVCLDKSAAQARLPIPTPSRFTFGQIEKLAECVRSAEKEASR